MAFPGRHNIYESTIRRMVTQALEDQELRFRQEHGQDPDASLLELVRSWARASGHTPWPGELAGGSYLTERFGSWDSLLTQAGLEQPTHPNRQQSFLRYRQETERQKERYRQIKAEKKQLAQKRLAEQAARRKARENR